MNRNQNNRTYKIAKISALNSEYFSVKKNKILYLYIIR